MADQGIHLLVHAGAPTSRQDDGKYMVQAEAYFNLTTSRGSTLRRPDSRVNTTPPVHAPSTCIVPRTLQKDPTMKPPHEDDFTGHCASVYVEDTQRAYTALETQLRSPSRSVTERTLAKLRTRRSQDSARTGDASRRQAGLSQSSYLVSPQLGRSRPKRRVTEDERVQRSPRQVQKPHIEAPPRHQTFPRTEGSEKENSGQQDDLDSTSELPTSYSLSADASTRSVDRPRLPENPVSDPGVFAASLAENVPERVPTTLSRKEHDKSASERRDNKASKVQVSSKRPRISTDISDPELRTSLLRLPTQILPRGPRTSIARFTTHVTPSLQRLIDQPAIANSFSPVSQTRELETSERGHWLVPCQGWTITEQSAFWESLEQSIGNAGWGVWCSRGTDEQLQNASDQPVALPATDAPQSQPLGPIRVWCWGEIAKHVYLLLYVASRSKVRRLGLQWIDSDGHVIVQMRQDKRTK